MKARTYKCSVIGLRHEGRADYILRHVKIGTFLKLVREPRNRHDPLAVAVYHGKRKIGYIPASKRWVAESLDEGNDHIVSVFDVDDDDGDLIGLIIDITITRNLAPRPQPQQPPGSGGLLALLRRIVRMG